MAKATHPPSTALPGRPAGQLRRDLGDGWAGIRAMLRLSAGESPISAFADPRLPA